MLEQTIRHRYQMILVDPIVKLIGDSVHPISITVLSGILGILFIPFLLGGHQFGAITCLLLSGYCDTLDGSLARAQKKQSDFGSVLDIMMDRLVEFSVVFGLFLIAPVAHALPAVLMLSSMLLCITSFLVVGIFSENNSRKSFHYSAGIMERAEAFVFFVAMTIFPSFFDVLAYAFTGLVLITAFIRLKQFYRYC